MLDTNITLDSIGGYEYQKYEAKKIVNFFKNYNSYIKSGAFLPKGIIFYGKPGTGKTMFATAIANESKAKLYSLSDEKFYDNSNLSLSVHRIFEEAKKNAPSIILIDELDQLVVNNDYALTSATDKQREMLRLLLTEIDKINKKGVLVIATSNTALGAIPAALTRNGRIEKHVMISNPDFDDRASILKIYLDKNKIFKNINAKELAKMTNGFTGCSLASLTNDVLLNCLSNNNKTVTYKDFYEPIQIIISHGIKRKPKKNVDDVIYHEIGHLIASYILKNEIGFINTESYGTSNGRYYKAGSEYNDAELSTLQDYKDEATINIAGLVATELFLGERYNGASKDLTNIYYLFSELTSNGLGDLKLVGETCANINRFETKTTNNFYKEFNVFLQETYENAKKLLIRNKKLILELFDVLKVRKYLDSNDIKYYIDKFNSKNTKKNINK